MPITQTAPIEEIATAREIAEQVLAEAKIAADTLRAMHATAVLHEQFPDHTLAVFARNWDEDEAKLIQLLSAEDVEDVELQEIAVLGTLSPEQLRAVETANIAVFDIGTDDDLRRHLTEGEEEHEGWYEFTLALTPTEPEFELEAADTADLSATPRAEPANADEATTEDEQESR